MAQHPIVHVEIAAKDPKATAGFYSSLFGWKIETDQNAGYVMFQEESGPAGGFPKVDNQLYKPGDVVVYIQTDDIDGMLKKITSLGGKVTTPKTEIPGEGWFALFADPNGNRLGLFTNDHAPA